MLNEYQTESGMVVCSMEKKKQTTLLCVPAIKTADGIVVLNEKADDMVVFSMGGKSRQHYCVEWRKKSRRHYCVQLKYKKKQAVLCSVIKAAATFVCSMKKNRRHGCVFNDKTGRH